MGSASLCDPWSLQFYICPFDFSWITLLGGQYSCFMCCCGPWLNQSGLGHHPILANSKPVGVGASSHPPSLPPKNLSQPGLGHHPFLVCSAPPASLFSSTIPSSSCTRHECFLFSQTTPPSCAQCERLFFLLDQQCNVASSFVASFAVNNATLPPPTRHRSLSKQKWAWCASSS